MILDANLLIYAKFSDLPQHARARAWLEDYDGPPFDMIIEDAFGGRDHTTVLHCCRRIAALRETYKRINEDYLNLLRTLTG